MEDPNYDDPGIVKPEEQSEDDAEINQWIECVAGNRIPANREPLKAPEDGGKPQQFIGRYLKDRVPSVVAAVTRSSNGIFQSTIPLTDFEVLCIKEGIETDWEPYPGNQPRPGDLKAYRTGIRRTDVGWQEGEGVGMVEEKGNGWHFTVTTRDGQVKRNSKDFKVLCIK